jgi:hypothetical protein
MNKRSSILITLFLLLMAMAVNAQNPNYDNGPVWRVVYFHINAGQSDTFWKDIHDNLKPIFEAQKQAGLISDYKFYNNVTLDSPEDWDVAIALLYKNWAAQDALAEKGATISVQHYGSRDAMIAAGKKRSEYAKVVASKLAREVTAK